MTEPLLGIREDVVDIAKSVDITNKSVSKFASELNKVETISKKLASGFLSVGKAVGGVAFGILNISEAINKLNTGYTLLTKYSQTLEDIKGSALGIDFGKAITGSTQLADNIQKLDQISNIFTDTLGQGINAALDPASFRAFQGEALSAYAQVQDAAYKLSTITVLGQERSIDALDRNIKSMRDLQKETNYAVDSVTLLNAQYDIASAGFTKGNETKNVGKASVNLSQAGYGNLQGSSNALVKTLRALGDSSEVADKRAAQLFETTKVGLLSLDQLSSEAGSLAVQSKQLGLSFDETLSALAALTTQGFSASEASTRLQAFFSEVANASQDANNSLASFKDEAGKPIQLNATALKTKGISGIIEDLKKATGGDLPKIQQLFSRQETSEAVSGLISVGKDTFQSYTQSIKDTDPNKLDAEAKGRQETLLGAYQKGANQSQKSIEELGQSFSAEGLEKLVAANELVDKLAKGSATFIGSISGGIAGFSEKVRSIGGLLFTAFSTVAPIVLFNTLQKKVFPVIGEIIKGVGKLRSSFDNLGDENATVFDKLKIAADKIFSYLVTKIDALVKTIQNKIKTIRETADSELDTSGSNAINAANNIVPYNKSNKQAGVQDVVEDSLPGVSGISLIKKSSDSAASAVAGTSKNISFLDKALSKVGSVGGSVFSGLRSGLGFIGGIFKDTAGQLLKFSIGGFAVAGALQIASGWANTFWLAFNKGAFNALPEIQELRNTLKEIQNIPALDKIVKDLDPVTSSLSTGNDLLDNIGGAVNEVGKSWSLVTGNTAKSEMVLNQYDKAIDALAIENASVGAVINNKTGKTGFVDAQSSDAKKAQSKLKANVELNTDDRNALQSDLDNKKKQLDAEIALRRKKIEQIENDKNANYSPAQISDLKFELKLLQDQTEVRKKNLELEYKKALLLDQVRKLQAVDTSKPLQGQLIKQQEEGIKSQITDVAGTYKAAIDNALNDPDKFNNLVSNIDSILGSIDVQVNLDAGSAQKLRDDLIKSVPDLDKLLFTNPQLRQKLGDLNKRITDTTVQGIQTTESAKTSVIGNVEGLGSNSTVDSARKYADQITSINAQADALNKELARPETTLARQKELISQIEDLESKRLNANIDNRIKQELTGKKLQVSLAQSLLTIEQARINLYQVESDSTILSVSSAKAKLAAAKEQLEVSQQQLDLSTKEEQIRKEEISKALKSQQARDKVNDARNKTKDEQAKSTDTTNNTKNTEKGTTASKKDQVTADQDLQFSKTIASLRGKFENLDKVVEIVKLGIDEEFAARTKNIEQAKNLGSSFEQLGQTASSLFSSSSLGAELQAIGKKISDPLNEVINTASKQIAQVNAVVKTDNALYKQVTQELDAAKKTGASSETIDKLTKKQQEAKVRASGSKEEAARDTEYIKQKTVVQALNAQLDKMQSEVQATTDALQKIAEVSKDTIDFEQRQKDSAAENNRSGTALQSSFLGFFGKNNPLAQQLQQRLDFKQNQDDAKLQKSKNVTEAKKEIIDLKVLQSQLELEQQAYENALTQTQLLADISNLLSGKQASFSGSDAFQKELAALPDKITKSRALAAERGDLVQSKLDFIPKELDQKNTAVDRDTLSKQLQSLGGNLNPGNIDLITQTLKDSQDSIKGFQRQNFDVGSLSDPSFQKTLSRLDVVNQTGSNRNSLKQGINTSNGSTGSNAGVSVQAPVNITLSVSGQEATNITKSPEAFKSYVGKQINSAMTKLSSEVTKLTRSY